MAKIGGKRVLTTAAAAAAMAAAHHRAACGAAGLALTRVGAICTTQVEGWGAVGSHRVRDRHQPGMLIGVSPES